MKGASFTTAMLLALVAVIALTILGPPAEFPKASDTSMVSFNDFDTTSGNFQLENNAPASGAREPDNGAAAFIAGVSNADPRNAGTTIAAGGTFEHFDGGLYAIRGDNLRNGRGCRGHTPIAGGSQHSRHALTPMPIGAESLLAFL